MRQAGWPLLALALGLLATAACGDAVGTPCQTRGSGFTARDPCRSECLDRWTVICPNEERVTPAVCAGRGDCEIGGCPAGQICYHFDDPFEIRAYCILAMVCPDLDTAGDALRSWEVAAARRAQETRARFKPESR